MLIYHAALNNLQQSRLAAGRTSKERLRSEGNTTTQNKTSSPSKKNGGFLTGKGSSQSKCGRISNALYVLQGA
jgi:hypothetical protein